MSISFFQFLLLGPGPAQMASALVLPPPEIRSNGGGVSWCTGRSPWTLLLSGGMYEIVLSSMQVVSLGSTCTQQPGSCALTEVDDVTGLSGMGGKGYRTVM